MLVVGGVRDVVEIYAISHALDIGVVVVHARVYLRFLCCLMEHSSCSDARNDLGFA